MVVTNLYENAVGFIVVGTMTAESQDLKLKTYPTSLDAPVVSVPTMLIKNESEDGIRNLSTVNFLLAGSNAI